MKTNSISSFAVALAALLFGGCQEARESRAVAESVNMGRSTLTLGSGDGLQGFYYGCHGHEDLDNWSVTIGNTAVSNLKVATRDTDCRIWLTALKKGTDVYTLILPGTADEPWPILIMSEYLKPQLALAKHPTNSADQTAVNAIGTGLSFTEATFGIQVLVGRPGEILSIEHTVIGPDLAEVPDLTNED